ncbi:hypothetical protein ACWCPS_22885 [Streptomyces mauvecolor]
MKTKASAYFTVSLALGLASATGPAAAPATAQPQPSSARHAAAAKRVVLTNADDGRPVVLAVGDDVEIRLTGSRSQGLTYAWSVPQAGDSGVLRKIAGGTTPTGGASAAFRAEKPGVVMIGSTRSCRPDPGRVCPDVVVPWNVTAKAT